MRFRTFKAVIAIVILTGVAMEGCKEKDPTSPSDSNEQELITTVRLTLVDTLDSVALRVATWRDVDGEGGNPPTIDTLHLTAGRVYTGEVLLLNESATPIDTVSHEVEEEANAHRFFYTPGGGIVDRVTVESLDVDTNTPPLPVGLHIRVTVSAGPSATGTLTVVLLHYDGDKPSGGGETDVEVIFPVMVE